MSSASLWGQKSDNGRPEAPMTVESAHTGHVAPGPGAEGVPAGKVSA
jgi:hypothetical protein